ncbi:MAG: hypothetical protein CMN85_16405 [Spongiibacteraceae bacterium]|nr:hypothetical protein [Spongiibacteraceae bacterium]|tara:strand:- start:454 stop:2667 length:2214 start_codon:yes stop_codon:yes gene_type:complete
MRLPIVLVALSITCSGPAFSENKPKRIEEVLVTANKRSQSISSIAGAVSAIDKAMLEETGAADLSEYLTLSAGVNFSSSTPGLSVVTIRGVSSDTFPGQAQTAVGIYYDDIPLTDPAAPMVVPDIDSFDADRVEILRGPQGALYGSASMGGAVNYIPIAPNPEEVDFAAQLIATDRTNSSVSYSRKVMLNVPLISDKLALRAVAHETETQGYIDNIGTGEEQANDVTTRGGRIALSWDINPGMMLKLHGLQQTIAVEDSGYVDERLDDLKKETTQPEPTDTELSVAGIRYEHSLDEHGDVVFVGSYQEKSSFLSVDGATALGIQDTGLGIILEQGGTVEGYSAEVRYISPPDDTFEYLLGLSYANRDEDFYVILDSAELAEISESIVALANQLGITLPSTLTAATTLFRQSVLIDAPEEAAFFEGSWQFVDNLRLVAGGRYYNNRIDSEVVGQGLLFLTDGSTEFYEQRSNSAEGFNPKVSLSWEPTDDILAYSLYSRGYRLGGPNLVPNNAIFNTKSNYEPDEVKNYEVGVKSFWFDDRLSIDIAAFYIDWRDMQLVTADDKGTFKYLDNAGDAEIKGVELSLVLAPLDFLNTRSTITWLDARLAEDYDPQNGRPPAQAGDRLPGSPEWSLSNTINLNWYSHKWQPSLTLVHRYEGESPSNLSFQDIKKGDYHLLDLRASLTFEKFSISFFGKNLEDKRGVTASNNYAGTTGTILSHKYITPPRSYGVQLDYKFAP